MKLFLGIFVIGLLANGSFAVQVTLQGGNKGTVKARVKAGESPLLRCSASPTTTSPTTDPLLEWTYAKTSTSTGIHLWHSGSPGAVQKNERIIIVEPYSLVISNLIANDTGIYTCRVTMLSDSPSLGYGKYNLTVLVPPYSKISCGFPESQKITLEEKTEFKCGELVAQAVPSPTYTWYKNGVQLPPNSANAPQFSNSSYSYNVETGIISFSSVVAGDAGEYQCEASNEVGSERCTAAAITIGQNNAKRAVTIPIGVLLMLACFHYIIV